jgi:glucosamine--fructose-6-phosphate aminotransferase (isomerizing)
LQEVKAREGMLIAVATEGDAEVARLCTHDPPARSSRPGAVDDPDVFYVPACEPEVLPLLTVLPLQLLAYHMADLKGTDVDQPRNLAKTVTVE